MLLTEPFKQCNLGATRGVQLASTEMCITLSAYIQAHLCLFPCVPLFLLTLMLQPVLIAQGKHQVSFVLFFS